MEERRMVSSQSFLGRVKSKLGPKHGAVRQEGSSDSQSLTIRRQAWPSSSQAGLWLPAPKYPEALVKVHIPRPYPRIRGSNPSSIDIWGHNPLLWKLFCAHRVFASIPGLYPVDTRPFHRTVSTRLSPEFSQCPLGRGHKIASWLRTTALDLLTQKLLEQGLGNLRFE